MVERLISVDVEGLGHVQLWSLVSQYTSDQLVRTTRCEEETKDCCAVGHHEKSGAAIFLTPDGVKRGTRIARMMEHERWDRVFQSWVCSSGLDSQLFKSFSWRRSGDSGLVIRKTMKLGNYLWAPGKFFLFLKLWSVCDHSTAFPRKRSTPFAGFSYRQCRSRLRCDLPPTNFPRLGRRTEKRRS